jgi:hypothetical protein
MFQLGCNGGDVEATLHKRFGIGGRVRIDLFTLTGSQLV